MAGAVPAEQIRSATPERASVIRRLLLASFLMLFVELALIRWLGANIIHLSYFSNFVLLGSFLGIGAGFLISRKAWSIWPWSLPLLAGLILLVSIFPVAIERGSSEVIFFTSPVLTGPPVWLVLPLVFLTVAAILAGPAELVGRCFAHLPPLTAYRYDLIGSLGGIVLFAIFSFLHAPPFVWGLVAFPIYWLLYDKDRRRPLIIGLMLAIMTIFTVDVASKNVSWSPYYKIATYSDTLDEALEIRANGIPHQVLGSAAWKLEQGEGIYETPYRRLPGNALEDVLIIGAGSGSDVAISLLEGARNVDAVEIDPRIFEIGRERNPDRPYSDPRVTGIITDGRAWLESTDKQYDLILFALPDSLTLVSGASQIRLESFLFTQEALETVRERLKPGGGFAMYNYYREPWLIDRLANTAASAFGHAPCIDTHAEMQAVISIARSPANQSCEGEWNPAEASVFAAPSTDDSPFLYFDGKGFPQIYLIALAGMLLATLITIRTIGGPFRTMRPYADLFFMGVGFLLLETRGIATFALLFGTTWFVNAIVFAGVLLVVLAAVETTRRFRTPSLTVLYALIALSLTASWLVPDAALLNLPPVLRAAAASVLAFMPIYLSNIAFSKRFEQSADSQSAFAINLLGAILGGCLEYTALLVGYNDLLIVAGFVYLIAFMLLPREARPGAMAAA